VRFGVLGVLAAWTVDGRLVEVREAKVRTLLADLLAAASPGSGALTAVHEAPEPVNFVEEPGEPFGKRGVLAEVIAEAFLDPVPVLDPHRDHAQRFGGPFPGRAGSRTGKAGG